MTETFVRQIKVCSLVLVTMAIGTMFNGCYYDVESELYPSGLVCDSLAISYAVDVRPVLVNKCLNCHSANVNSGSVTLETYAQVKTQVDNGMLACTINHEAGCSAMPQDAAQLPPCELKAINVWISEGALDN